jgi:chromosome segregation ATPase
MAPGAKHAASGLRGAISEDFGAQLHDAQEKLLELRQQQSIVERQQEELEELQGKQDRFLKGRVDIVERLNKGLTRLDRETFQARKRLEMLDHAKETFTVHLDSIEGFNPEHWSRSELRSELVRATAALEDAEQDYAEAVGRLGLDRGETLREAISTPPGASPAPAIAASTWPSVRYWLIAGLAFTLPLVVLLILLLIQLRP